MLQIYKNLIRNDKTEVGFCYLIAVEKYEEINFTLRLRQIQKNIFDYLGIYSEKGNSITERKKCPL